MVKVIRDEFELQSLINSYVEGFYFDLVNHTLKCLDSKRNKNYPYTIGFEAGNVLVSYDHELDKDTIRMFNRDSKIRATIIERSNGVVTYIRKENNEVFQMKLFHNENNELCADLLRKESINKENGPKLELK